MVPLSCLLCRTGSYCSGECMDRHEGHRTYCKAICMLEQIEWEKKKKALVCVRTPKPQTLLYIHKLLLSLYIYFRTKNTLGLQLRT